jgi:serine protease Do
MPRVRKTKPKNLLMKASPLALPLLMAGGLAISESRGAEPSANLSLARQLNQAFVEVAEKVSPAVVVINVVAKAGSSTPDDSEDNGDDPYEDMPPQWRRFHKQIQPSPDDPVESQGSGVIVRKDGYILTNYHVVDGAERVTVRLRDGRTFTAHVRGVDPASDVAVVKIDASNLPVAELADSAKTRVGEFAIAIGAPFSLDYSVTYGHVSAKGRSNVVPASSGGSGMDQDFIQTDANINPGNSGGPLVNIDGQVIGINTMIHGLHTGIGFAIPSNLAREISEKLITDGKFTRAWLGVGIYAVRDDPDFQQLVTGVSEGVVVHSIVSDGPAAKSDLKLGDVITAVDGKAVSTAQELRDEVREKAVGQPLTLDVFRKDKVFKVKLSPAEYVDPNVDALASAPNDASSAPTSLGVTIHPLTPELAKQFNTDMTEGVMVVAVQRNSPADQKDIQPGDIITALNQQPVSNPKQFREALKRADLKRGVIVNLISGDSARFEILRQEAE